MTDVNTETNDKPTTVSVKPLPPRPVGFRGKNKGTLPSLPSTKPIQVVIPNAVSKSGSSHQQDMDLLSSFMEGTAGSSPSSPSNEPGIRVTTSTIPVIQPEVVPVAMNGELPKVDMTISPPRILTNREGRPKVGAPMPDLEETAKGSIETLVPIAKSPVRSPLTRSPSNKVETKQSIRDLPAPGTPTTSATPKSGRQVTSKPASPKKIPAPPTAAPAMPVPSSDIITQRVDTPMKRGIMRPASPVVNIPRANRQVPIVNVEPIGTIHSEATPMSEATPANIAANINILQQFGPAAMPVKPQRPNYSAMSLQQQQEVRIQFNTKFAILQQSFPGWTIVVPPATHTLDQVHDAYEGYVKQITISYNCNQWKVYLVVMFLIMEIVCVKGLKIKAARGATMRQVKIMNRYDSLLVELGEKYYVQGPSNWPVEARILLFGIFNMATFIGIKYLADWMGGGEVYADALQGAIDNMLGTGAVLSGASNRDQFGIPIPPGAEAATAAAAAGGDPATAAQAGAGGLGGLGGLGSLINNLMGQAGTPGANVDLTSLLGNIGSMLGGGGAAPRPTASSVKVEVADGDSPCADKPKPRKGPRFTAAQQS